MKVNRNRTFYYIKEGITSIFTHSLMSFASICIIIAFLVIMGSFILLAVNINALIGELESDNIILAYIHENISESEAQALAPTLRSIDNVSSVIFITREEAMENFIGRYDNSERYRDIDATWFRHRYAVYVEDVALIAETQQALRYVRELDTINANLAIARALVTLRTVVSWVSIIVILILLAISLFIMSNTIKLATYERREEIAIMKMVGATNAFIRWPFIFEGFILGLTGSLLAFVTIWGLYGMAAGRVLEIEAGFFQLVQFSMISVPVFMLFTAIGFGVGVGGSGLALNRYLKV
ncbi:MAG: permease-like cell division protein FtsX [Oscillospiraceae bacterium]|nr:permease-like cell division protein FtsX [Oscillospiraceae bacterium]